MALTEREQEIEVALAPMPEPEIAARDHDPNPEPGDEKRLDELHRRHRAQTRIEAQQRDAVERQRVQRGQLLPQPGEAGRRILSGEELQRLRLEGDEDRGGVAFAAERGELVDQRPVTEMHPVEIADRGDTAVVLGTHVVPAAYHFQVELSWRGM